ncbi:MAG: hypothetical protein IPL02_13155 [Moraxellaceae bacterium]|nr:hypothetical protein [Moraxellaceae bacterium]
MKRHPLALMITLAILQSGCSYKDAMPQQQSNTPSPEYPTSLKEDALISQEADIMATNQAPMPQRANLKKRKARAKPRS